MANSTNEQILQAFLDAHARLANAVKEISDKAAKSP